MNLRQRVHFVSYFVSIMNIYYYMVKINNPVFKIPDFYSQIVPTLYTANLIYFTGKWQSFIFYANHNKI